MRIKSIKNNKHGNPKQLTVVMSVDEAGVIAKTFGGFSPLKFESKFPNLNDNVSDEIYGCLVGEFFNKTWDNGVDGWLGGETPGGDF